MDAHAGDTKRLTGNCLVIAGLLIGMLLANRVLTPRTDLISPAATKSLIMLVANLSLAGDDRLVVLNAGSRWLGFLRDRRLVYWGPSATGSTSIINSCFEIWENFAAYYGWEEGPLAGSCQVCRERRPGVAFLAFPRATDPCLQGSIRVSAGGGAGARSPQTGSGLTGVEMG